MARSAQVAVSNAREGLLDPRIAEESKSVRFCREDEGECVHGLLQRTKPTLASSIWGIFTEDKESVPYRHLFALFILD